MPSLVQWIIRNFALLVGGIILLPLSMYALLMFVGFGHGFIDGESNTATVFMWLISLYVLVFGLSVKLSRRSLRINGDYAYWDFLPIAYFFTVFVLMFWGRF